MYRFGELEATIYPALLALASVAALAVVWWAFRQVAEGRRMDVLGPFREFRFRDDLVWVLIVGIAFFVLPLGSFGTRIGSNLMTFMGALYAVRGIAVLLALWGSPGFFAMLFLGLAAFLIWPLVMMATFLVGVTDIWLDLRARRTAAAKSTPEH